MAPDTTELLRRWRHGDHDAGALVVARTYDELRHVARAHLRGERFARSLGATGLLHEAFVRLIKTGPGTVEGREAFLRLMAAEMRRRLIDRARRRLAAKRGAGIQVDPLEDDHHQAAATTDEDIGLDLDRLDAALDVLTSSEPRAARVVQLRFLAGMTTEETADVLGVSSGTVKRDWTFARAWLAAAMDRARTTG